MATKIPASKVRYFMDKILTDLYVIKKENIELKKQIETNTDALKSKTDGNAKI